MSATKSNKILTNKQAIQDWIGECSDYMFKKYISLGMPARFEDGRWTAHGDNIDEFFRRYTMVSMKSTIDKIQEGPERPP